MVYLIATPAGWDAIRPRLDFAHDVVWVGSDTLTSAERDGLRAKGCNLSWFVYPLNAADLTSEIATVAEHHPGQIILAEVTAV